MDVGGGGEKHPELSGTWNSILKLLKFRGSPSFFFDKQGNIYQKYRPNNNGIIFLPSLCKNKSPKKKCLSGQPVKVGAVCAWNVVSPPGTWRFCRRKPLHRHKDKNNQSLLVSPAPPSPLFSLFTLFCPLTISPPNHSPPTLPSVSLFLFWAIGLLFMASPIEDALLYKTLEPASRPTSFEDVATNSYLGL